MLHFDPRQDVGKTDSPLLIPTDHSLIVLDFENPDIKWLSGAFQAILVRSHFKLFNTNGAPQALQRARSHNQAVPGQSACQGFNIYLNLE